MTHFVGDIHYLRPGLQRRMNRPCHSFLVVTCRASQGRRRYNTSYRSYRKARRLFFFFRSLHLFPLCARPAPLPLETLNDAWLWRVISPEFCCFARTFLFSSWSGRLLRNEPLFTCRSRSTWRVWFSNHADTVDVSENVSARSRVPHRFSGSPLLFLFVGFGASIQDAEHA